MLREITKRKSVGRILRGPICLSGTRVRDFQESDASADHPRPIARPHWLTGSFVGLA